VSLLAACGQDKAIEEVVLVTVTAVPVSPTSISQSPTLTPTPSATATTIPTPTPTPSATATTTPIPTLTPLPTFAPEELETAVADLLTNPMNCDVPCLWGVIPNDTTFFEIYQFLELHQLTDYMHYLEDEGPNDRFDLWMGYDKNTNAYDFLVSYGFKNNVLKSLTSGIAPSIASAIEKFGQPDEIWLETGVSPIPIPFRLNMIYLEESMAFGYVTDGDVQSGMFKGCFTDEESSHLRLLAPNTATSYKDFPTIFEKDRHYLPLEEATGLTMAEFMQQFSDPNQPQCLETPIELWE
jgi:hypothetical protein